MGGDSTSHIIASTMEHAEPSEHPVADEMASSAMPGADVLSPAMDRSRPVVIVTHGSMNPVHSGHVAMMVRAKEAVEAQGW